jgi:hypothetical protein
MYKNAARQFPGIPIEGVFIFFVLSVVTPYSIRSTVLYTTAKLQACNGSATALGAFHDGRDGMHVGPCGFG